MGKLRMGKLRMGKLPVGSSGHGQNPIFLTGASRKLDFRGERSVKGHGAKT